MAHPQPFDDLGTGPGPTGFAAGIPSSAATAGGGGGGDDSKGLTVNANGVVIAGLGDIVDIQVSDSGANYSINQLIMAIAGDNRQVSGDYYLHTYWLDNPAEPKKLSYDSAGGWFSLEDGVLELGANVSQTIELLEEEGKDLDFARSPMYMFVSNGPSPPGNPFVNVPGYVLFPGNSSGSYQGNWRQGLNADDAKIVAVGDPDGPGGGDRPPPEEKTREQQMIEAVLLSGPRPGDSRPGIRLAEGKNSFNHGQDEIHYIIDTPQRGKTDFFAIVVSDNGQPFWSGEPSMGPSNWKKLNDSSIFIGPDQVTHTYRLTFKFSNMSEEVKNNGFSGRLKLFYFDVDFLNIVGANLDARTQAINAGAYHTVDPQASSPAYPIHFSGRDAPVEVALAASSHDRLQNINPTQPPVVDLELLVPSHWHGQQHVQPVVSLQGQPGYVRLGTVSTFPSHTPSAGRRKIVVRFPLIFDQDPDPLTDQRFSLTFELHNGVPDHEFQVQATGDCLIPAHGADDGENQDLSGFAGDSGEHKGEASVTGSLMVYWKGVEDKSQRELRVDYNSLPRSQIVGTLVIEKRNVGSDSSATPKYHVTTNAPSLYRIDGTFRNIEGGLEHWWGTIGSVGKHELPIVLKSSGIFNDEVANARQVFGVYAEDDRKSPSLHVAVDVFKSGGDQGGGAGEATKITERVGEDVMTALGYPPGFAVRMLQDMRNTRQGAIQLSYFKHAMAILYACNMEGDKSFLGTLSKEINGDTYDTTSGLLKVLKEVSNQAFSAVGKLQEWIKGIFGSLNADEDMAAALESKVHRASNFLGQVMWNSMQEGDRQALRTMVDLPIQAIILGDHQYQAMKTPAAGAGALGALGQAAGGVAGGAATAGATMLSGNLPGAISLVRVAQSLRNSVTGVLGGIFGLFKVVPSNLVQSFAEDLQTSLGSSLKAQLHRFQQYLSRWIAESRQQTAGQVSELFPRGFITAEERATDISQIAAGLNPKQRVADISRGGLPPPAGSLAQGAGVFPGGQLAGSQPGAPGAPAAGGPQGSFYQGHPLLDPQNIQAPFQNVPQASVSHEHKARGSVAAYLSSLGVEAPEQSVDALFNNHVDIAGQVGYISQDNVLGTRPSHFHTPKVISEPFEILRAANKAIERQREAALDRKVIDLRRKKRKAIESHGRQLQEKAAKRHQGRFIKRDVRRLFKTPGQREAFVDMDIVPEHSSEKEQQVFAKAFFTQ